MPKLPWYFKLAFLFCWSAAVLADPTFSVTSPEGKLTLTSEPCTQHPWMKNWQVARWQWRGKEYEACWKLQKSGPGPDDKLVAVIDSDGDVPSFDPRQFTKDEAI